MGVNQSKSTSTSETVANIATDIISKHSLECIVSASQSQLISVSDVGGDVVFDGSQLDQGWMSNVS